MIIQFLEFALGVFALYLITQQMIPRLFPNDFDINWLFKGGKKKRIEDKAEELEEKKKRVHGEIDEAFDLAAKEVERKQKAKDMLDKLK